MCKRAAKQSNSHFCSKNCVAQAEKAAPGLLEVPFGHTTFTSGEYILVGYFGLP